MLKKRGALVSFARAMYSTPREDETCASGSPEKDCITFICA